MVDASSIQRSLYLSYQLLEIGKPVIVVLNMMDVAKRRGMQIDIDALAAEFKVPVIEAVASKQIGREEILAAISAISEAQSLEQSPPQAYQLFYPELEAAIDTLAQRIASEIEASVAPRWFALKLLEGNAVVQAKLLAIAPALAEAIATVKQGLAQQHPELDAVSSIAATRHAAASALCHHIVHLPAKSLTSLTALIDKVVLNRYLSFVVLALVVYGTYELSIVKGYELTNYT